MATDKKQTFKQDRRYFEAQQLLEKHPPDNKKATQLFFEAAKAGDANAQCEYAYSCEKGRGREIDLAEAVTWYKKAADQGIRIAQNNYAGMLLHGLGVAKNIPEAIRWLQKAYTNGYLHAAVSLGQIYELGCPGVIDINEKLAEAWYLKGSTGENPDPDALEALGLFYKKKGDNKKSTSYYQQAFDRGKKTKEIAFLLGDAYAFGTGVNKDTAKAVKFYSLAAKQGDVIAANNLGRFYLYGQGVPKNGALAIQFLQQAADGGELEALLTLGNLHYEGLSGVLPQNSKKALDCFERAAKQKDARAAWTLGEYYANGIPGLAPDHIIAFRHYKNAAIWGKKSLESQYVYAADAALKIALYLERGYVNTQGEESVLSWLEKAHQMGSGIASYQLGFAHQTGWAGVKIDPNEALKFYRTSAERGYIEGEFGYANLIADKEPATAMRLHEKAAKKGNSKAAYNLGKMYLANNNEAQGWRWIEQAAMADHLSAMVYMADRYAKEGIAKDSKAFFWFKKAADKGHAASCHIIAIILHLSDNKKEAEKYFRRSAAEGNTESFFSLANLFKNENEELANYIAIGNPFEKLEGADKKKKLYILLKRFAEVAKLIRKREAGTYSSQLDNIYAAIAAEFDVLSSNKEDQKSDNTTQFDARLGKLESELSQLAQVKAKWEKIEAAEKARLRAAEAKSATATKEQKETTSTSGADSEPDSDMDSDSETDAPPSSAPAQHINKDDLPTPIRALYLKLLRLHSAINESEVLAESKKIEDLTKRREGLLEAMGGICRQLALKHNEVIVGEFSAMHDAGAQCISNYMWHAKSLKVLINQDNKEAQFVKIQQIVSAADKILKCLLEKMLLIQNKQDPNRVQALCLTNISDNFLTEARTTKNYPDIEPDVIIAHYKQAFGVGYRKRDRSVLSHNRWLRLVAMTASAYAQIRDNDPERYYERENLLAEHEAVQRLGQWIRHPKKLTYKHLTNMMRRNQRRSKAQHFSDHPANMMGSASMVAPAENKMEVKATAPAAVPGADDALKQLAQQIMIEQMLKKRTKPGETLSEADKQAVIRDCQSVSWGRVRSQNTLFATKEPLNEARAKEIAALFTAVNGEFQKGVEPKPAPGLSGWRVYIPAKLLQEELVRRKAAQLPDSKNATATIVPSLVPSTPVSTAANNLAQSWGRSGVTGANPAVASVAAPPQPMKKSASDQNEQSASP